jgi:hypothetical protein
MTTAFATTSRNAAKHNCTSKLLILPSESAEEFSALHASLVAEYQPETAMQNETVDVAARAVWELRRINREFDKTQEKLYSQQPEMSKWTPQQHAELERMHRYRTRAERSHGRTLKSLEYLRTLRLRAEQRAFWESIQLAKLDISKRRLQQASQQKPSRPTAPPTNLQTAAPSQPLNGDSVEMQAAPHSLRPVLPTVANAQRLRAS